MVVAKVVLYSVGALATGWTVAAIASPAFKSKLDRNIFRPCRNYNADLSNINRL